MNRRQFTQRFAAIAAAPLLPQGVIAKTTVVATRQPWAAVAAAPMMPAGVNKSTLAAHLVQASKLTKSDSIPVNQLAQECDHDFDTLENSAIDTPHKSS